ncbi:MAG: hypothetical protein WEC15_04355 [Flavobacteriales bacterium]
MKMPAHFQILSLSFGLAIIASFRYPTPVAPKPGSFELGIIPIDTPECSLIGEWELAVNGGRRGPKLNFDQEQVHFDTLAYRYTIEGDSLRIFTEYEDHPGDGNSHGRITKLNYDSLVVHWREGDVNTYLRTREPKH